MISKMFKPPNSNQRYEYIPRFYDPDKEALEERLAMKERARAGDKVAIKAQIRTSMRRERDRKVSSKYVAKSNITIMAIFAILLVGAIVLLNVYLPAFLEVILNG